MAKLDRLDWAAGFSFTAYGRLIGIRVTDTAVLDVLPPYLPPGRQPSDETEVEGLYSLRVGEQRPRKGTQYYNLVYIDAARLARTFNLDEALAALGSHMQLLVAANSTEGLFVHAGVVGWQGKALLIPGRSFAGKSTLVAELIKAGATYYSDEYAVIDAQGQVWPYPRLLSLRNRQGQHARRCAPEELGGKVGVRPLPVGLVLVTEYLPGARWQAHPLSPGRAMLALLGNTVAARAQPADAMDRLQKVAANATAYRGERGEAADVAARILELVPA